MTIDAEAGLYPAHIIPDVYVSSAIDVLHPSYASAVPIPYMIFSQYQNGHFERLLNSSPRHFAAYAVSNCRAQVRNQFYRLISKYKQIDHLASDCINGKPRDMKDRFDEATYLTSVRKAFRAYKFAIVFENQARRGYITEKIMNAYLSGAVPIYFGAPDISKYVNVNATIICKPPQYACIDRIKAADSSDALFNELRSEPLLLQRHPLLPLIERLEAVIPRHLTVTRPSEMTARHQIVKTSL